MNKVLFWDFDGTLTYSSPLWTTSLLSAINKYNTNHEITFNNIRPHMTYGFPWHESESKMILVGEAWWEYMFKKFKLLFLSYGLEESIADIASKEVRNIILNPSVYTLYKDATIALEACMRKGFKNYILSNNYPELESTINKLDLSKYFDGYIVSGMIGYNKPQQEIFEYAFDTAKHPDISYMIGDNPTADIEGGLNAGIKTILVHNNNVKSNADYSVETLFDIISLL